MGTTVAKADQEFYYVECLMTYENVRSTNAAFIVLATADASPEVGTFMTVWGTYVYYNVTDPTRQIFSSSQGCPFEQCNRRTIRNFVVSPGQGQVRLLIKLLSRPAPRTLLTGNYTLEVFLTQTPAVAPGRSWFDRYAPSGRIPFSMLLQQVVITAFPSVVSVTPSGGTIRGSFSADIDGPYNLVPVIRSITSSGWVLGGIEVNASSGTFTFRIARYIPRGNLTFELAAVPDGGSWSDRISSVAIPFTVVDAPIGLGGSQSLEGTTGKEAGKQTQGMYVALLAVVAILSVTVFVIFRRTYNASTARTLPLTSDADSHAHEPKIGFDSHVAWQLHR